MVNTSDRLKEALCLSADQGQHRPLLRLLRRHRRDPLDADELSDGLAGRHPNLERRFLHPRLLPAELLVAPEQWRPEHAGLHLQALLASHQDLSDTNQLIASGVLNRILLGELPLYDDLPALAIDAYALELKQPHRAICKREQLCALAHLSSFGRDAFQRNQPVAACLDLYNHVPPVQTDIPLLRPRQRPQLVVMDADPRQALRMGRSAGWETVLAAPLRKPAVLWTAISTMAPETPVSFCHHSDRLRTDALDQLSSCWHNQPDLALCSSDELIAWNPTDPTRTGHPQCRAAATAARLICRGGFGGLVTIRAKHLQQLVPPQEMQSMHELLVNLALQVLANGGRSGHCSETLLTRTPFRNPSLLDIASPMEQQVFHDKQIAALNRTLATHAEPFLAEGGWLEPHHEIPGAQRCRWKPETSTIVTILIPFKDQSEVTQACIDSIHRYAGEINYEIILINNNSLEQKTFDWLSTFDHERDIKILNINSEFNFASLNNAGRRSARGNFLLLLNNDIEFHSAKTLEHLLAPFAFKSTGAVGSRLRYPDGSLQHQGAVMIRGERRALLEPGKGIADSAILNRLTPLRVEEEFSAASAACLMIKTDVFDAVQGFNEEFAVTFNDVDLCLRLRQKGYSVMVTPYPNIIHHEGKSRGKDLEGQAFARQQKEQGLLRHEHAKIYQQGDQLTSHHLHPHSRTFALKENSQQLPRQLVKEQIVNCWERDDFKNRSSRKTLLFFAHYDHNGQVRDDLFDLLESYRKHADLVLISSTPELSENKQILQRLKRHCDAVIVRNNEGYDFGSWMTGLRFFARRLKNYNQIVLTNDSLWGPVRPLTSLFERINECDADVIGLTDDLMYDYHLQSSFLVFRESALQSKAFQRFWQSLQVWPTKRELVKACEVGLSQQLHHAGLCLKSLYLQNNNGNALHFYWKNLIEEQDFPFLKVSLLRDNPTGQDLTGWQKVISAGNKKLAKRILNQIQELHD